MTKTTHINIQCPQCSQTDFELPDNVQDDDFVKCVFCGNQIMLCDLKEIGIEQAKEAVIPEVKREIEDLLAKSFKGFLK